MDVTGKYICKVLHPVLCWSHCFNPSCRFRIASKLDAGQKYLCLTRWKLLTWKLLLKKVLGLLLFEAWKIFKMSVSGRQVL